MFTDSRERSICCWIRIRNPFTSFSMSLSYSSKLIIPYLQNRVDLYHSINSQKISLYGTTPPILDPTVHVAGPRQQACRSLIKSTHPISCLFYCNASIIKRRSFVALSQWKLGNAVSMKLQMPYTVFLTHTLSFIPVKDGQQKNGCCFHGIISIGN